VPAYRSAATVGSSIPGTTEGVIWPKKELKRRKLHNAGPQAPSGRHFTSKTVSPRKSYAIATANCVLEIPPADTDLITLMTTVQQIMTGLQTADTEQDSFAVIMRAVYGLVMRK